MNIKLCSKRIIVFDFAKMMKDKNVKIYIDQFTLFAFLATGLADWHSSACIGEVESLTLKKRGAALGHPAFWQ